MGAITVTLLNPGDITAYFGDRKIVFGTIQMSSSYAAGGDTFTAGQFGFEHLDYLDVGLAANANPGTAFLILAPILPTATGLTAGGHMQALVSGASLSGPFTENAVANISAYTAPFMAIGW